MTHYQVTQPFNRLHLTRHLQLTIAHLFIDLDESNSSQTQDPLIVQSTASKPTDIIQPICATQPTNAVSVQLGDGVSIEEKTLFIKGNQMAPFSSLPRLSNIGPIEHIEISYFEFYPESISALAKIVSLPEVRLKKLCFFWCTFTNGAHLSELFSRVKFDSLEEFHLTCSNLKYNEIEEILSTLPSTIKLLNLSLNNLCIQEKKEFPTLSNLKNLETLMLNSCKLNVYEGTSFLDFAFNSKSLKHFHLESNPLILNYLFTKFNNWKLIELSISQSAFKADEEFKIENLSRQTELEFLDISGITLQSDHASKLIDSMNSMRKLRFFSFNPVNFPFDLVEKILIKFPSISIECDEEYQTKFIKSREHFIKNLTHLKLDYPPIKFDYTLQHLFYLRFGKIENSNDWQTMKRIITLFPNLKTLSIDKLQLEGNGKDDLNAEWLFNRKFSSIEMITISELVYENEKQLGLFMRSIFIAFPNLEELIIEMKSKTEGEENWIEEVSNSIKQNNTKIKLYNFNITMKFDRNILKSLFEFLEIINVELLTLKLSSIPDYLGNTPQLQTLSNIGPFR